MHPARDKDRFEEQTALQLAAALGRVEVAKLLLSRGADVEARQGDGSDRTALHKVAASGRIEMIDVLLAARASIDAVDSWFETALCKATRLAADRRDGDAREAHLAVTRRLLEGGAGFSFGYSGELHMFEDMGREALSFVFEHQWAADRGARVRDETSRPLLVWAARLASALVYGESACVRSTVIASQRRERACSPEGTAPGNTVSRTTPSTKG